MTRPMLHPTRAALAAPALLVPLLAGLAASSPAQDEKPRPTFDPEADAPAAVDGALDLAAKKHRRALLVWGHEAGAGHAALVDALRRGRTETWPFYYEYAVVPVHRGADGKGNAALVERLAVEMAGEPPLLTVLDAEGTPLAHRSAASFRDGDGWSEEKLGAFLTEHAVEPLDAEEVLKDACAEAVREKKRLFVHFGAPWWGWCKRLEEFLERPKVAPLFAKDWLVLEIDVDRMKHGKQVEERFTGGKARGYPWSIIVDPEQKVLATADGPEGNIGCPVTEAEAAHFFDMLTKTRQRVTDADLAVLRAEHAAFAKPILERMRGR